MSSIVEQHPLTPFLPENARILFLGSFPPPRKRWSMDFYYPNLQNDFWRIMGILFYKEQDHFIITSPAKCFDKEAIIRFLQERGIALYDTAEAVRRLQDNASDKFLEVVSPTPIVPMLERLPHCRTIAVTGQKAMDNLRSQVEIGEPPIGESVRFTAGRRAVSLYRMPSTSRAYPLSIEKKAESYRKLFIESGLL